MDVSAFILDKEADETVEEETGKKSGERKRESKRIKDSGKGGKKREGKGKR